jgi:hypothetical protein
MDWLSEGGKKGGFGGRGGKERCHPNSLYFNAFDTAADLEWTCSFS